MQRVLCNWIEYELGFGTDGLAWVGWVSCFLFGPYIICGGDVQFDAQDKIFGIVLLST